MSDDTKKQTDEEKIHPIQRLFDRPFVLLAAGMVVMLVFYTFWGVGEIMSLEKAPLP